MCRARSSGPRTCLAMRNTVTRCSWRSNRSTWYNVSRTSTIHSSRSALLLTVFTFSLIIYNVWCGTITQTDITTIWRWPLMISDVSTLVQSQTQGTQHTPGRIWSLQSISDHARNMGSLKTITVNICLSKYFPCCLKYSKDNGEKLITFYKTLARYDSDSRTKRYVGM